MTLWFKWSIIFPKLKGQKLAGITTLILAVKKEAVRSKVVSVHSVHVPLTCEKSEN